MNDQDATPEQEDDDDLPEADLQELAERARELDRELKMSRRKAAIFFAIGCAIMATAGILPEQMGLWRLPIYFVALIGLFAGVLTRGLTLPETSLILLLDLNATFWAAFVCWKLRLHFAAHPVGWVDPYPAAQVLWLLPLGSLGILQALSFWNGIRNGIQRSTGVVGLLAMVLQYFTTWHTATRLSGIK